jgi:hypothetical protein
MVISSLELRHSQHGGANLKLKNMPMALGAISDGKTIGIYENARFINRLCAIVCAWPFQAPHPTPPVQCG